MSEPYVHRDVTKKFLDRKLWSRLIGLTKGHRFLLFFSLAILLLSEIPPLLQPRLLKQIIDGPIASGNPEDIPRLVLIFLVVVILGGILGYGTAVCSKLLGLKIIHKLRTELFERTIHFKMEFFHRTPVGRLMTRLGNDIDTLNTMFSEGLIELLGAVLMILYAIGFMMFLDWRLATVSLVVLPFMVYITSIFRVKVRNVNIDIRRWVAELNSVMQESLNGINVVQIFGKSKERFKVFDNANAACRNAWYKNVRYFSLFFPGVLGLTEISLVLLFLTGSFLFFRNEVSIGTLVAFSWYSGMFFRPLRELSDRITTLQSALAASERVFTLWDTDAFMPDGKSKLPGKAITAEFRDVSFAYNTQTVLKNISFKVSPRNVVALVGATGSGKSTIMSLCNRFYFPKQGEVLLDDIPIENIKESALRKNIGLISQDVHLFAESVAFNIAMSTEYDLEMVEQSCKRAHCHDLIQQRGGYLTRMSSKGENFSPGQRQLLSFARAFYHQPKFLLLDEATSSVDSETEERIQAALVDITKDTTTLVVAHRLSTIRNSDNILVLHKGELRESGTHAELLSQKGIYHKLYQLQSFE